MDIKRYDRKYIRVRILQNNGVWKMAVSKATLSCVQGEIGTRLIRDIKSSSINIEALRSCESLLKKLSGKE